MQYKLAIIKCMLNRHNETKENLFDGKDYPSSLSDSSTKSDNDANKAPVSN